MPNDDNDETMDDIGDDNIKNGCDSSNENENSKPNNSQRTWINVKDQLFRVKLDDILYFCICFLTLSIVPLSGIAVGADYYEVALNRRPVSESILVTLNCTEQDQILADEELQQSICSMDTFEIKYTLFDKKVNYFHFKPTFGLSFCEYNNNTFSSDGSQTKNNATDQDKYFYTGELSEATQRLLGEDIGECSETTLLVTVAFAFLTMVFASIGAFWFMVLNDHYDYTKRVMVHFGLSTATMISSLITILLFCWAINPLRSNIHPAFCDGQSVFRDCEETLGRGWYCQIATAAGSFLQIFIYAVKSRFDTSETVISCCGRNSSDGNEGGAAILASASAEDYTTREKDQSASGHHQPQSTLVWLLHFFVKLGRFLEFFLTIVALLVNFTTLNLTLPDVSDTPVQMPSYLWGNEFCSGHFIVFDMFRMAQDDDEYLEIKNYGDCTNFDKLEVYAAFAKILFFGGASLFLKRDAAKNPLFYLAGLGSDVGTILFVCLAIHSFLTKIYPGRKEIEPSFCDQYNHMKNMLGFENPEDNCSIHLGPGFYVLCVVLVLTVVNLLAEFLVGELGSKYGAFNAITTITNRLRRRDFEGIMKPASCYNLGQDGCDVPDTIEPKMSDGKATHPDRPNGALEELEYPKPRSNPNEKNASIEIDYC